MSLKSFEAHNHRKKLKSWSKQLNIPFEANFYKKR